MAYVSPPESTPPAIGIKELEKRLAAGDFGKVNLMTLNFGSIKPYDMQNRFFNKELAGGALLDIGVYALSCARMFFTSAPDAFNTMMKEAPSGADEQSVMILKNADSQMATIALSLHSKQPKRAMISCEKAYIEIMEYPRSGKALIRYSESGETEEIVSGSTEEALVYELKDMEAAIDGDRTCMRLDYTTDVMRLMSDIRERWNYSYDCEMK